jgi:hypothetical protein
MSARFVIPDWMVPADPAPQPDLTDVDPYRVEHLVNRFIAAKQDALFIAPDAYYRHEGSDAVQLHPHITNRLTGLKDELLLQPLPNYPRSSDQFSADKRGCAHASRNGWCRRPGGRTAVVV